MIGALQCIAASYLQGGSKLKYPTWQNAIARQPCEIFIRKFLDLYGRDPATILNFKKYFSFLQSYGYINILCYIFNCARNNQQQLVIFVVKKHWLLSFQRMFEASTTSFHTSPKSFREAQYGFVDRVLWQLVPYQLQNFLELIDVLRLGLKWLVAFKHSSPDMVVQRVEVRRVRRPFIFFTDEFTAVGIAIQSWASFAVCAGAPSCWKIKPDGSKTDLQSRTSAGNRV